MKLCLQMQLSPPEAARRLRLKLSTVKSRLSRGRRELRNAEAQHCSYRKGYPVFAGRLTGPAVKRIHSRKKNSPTEHQVFGAEERRSFAATLTSSARESTFIFRITLPRCALTVISLIPSSPPTCLFNKPDTTRAITCCSRAVSEA